MKRALVLGAGVSGKAARSFLVKRGVAVTAADRNGGPGSEEVFGFSVHRDDPSLSLKEYDVLVLSPGIPLDHPLCAAAEREKVPVVGEAELALSSLSCPVLGITGTNGKTTVASLIAHVLNKSGIPAEAAGNIGIPLTEASGGKVVVAELSSYQLETLRSKVLDYALILNITPDHLDRYKTMENYAKAKLLIGRCLKPGGLCYVEESAWARYAGLASEGKFNVLKQKLENFDLLDYNPAFEHESKNIAAALALCRKMGVADTDFFEGVRDFKKEPHRIEFVREFEGVNYYNDSKGTNAASVEWAVKAMKGEVILIAGGVDKGGGYASWIPVFKEKVKMVCVIGEASQRIDEELAADIPVKGFDSLQSVVEFASRLAQPGQNVLLSPGCSSFDMFKDYKDRGEQFKQIVNALA